MLYILPGGVFHLRLHHSIYISEALDERHRLVVYRAYTPANIWRFPYKDRPGLWGIPSVVALL